MQGRWNQLSGVVAVVATVGLGAAAFQIDPEVVTDIDTPATGLWIPAQTSGEIVHVDAASGEVTARVAVAEPGAEVVIAERDDDVVVVDRTAGVVSLVDPGLHTVVRDVEIVRPAESMIDIGPDAIVAATPSAVSVVDGEVRTSTRADLGPTIRSVAVDGTGGLAEDRISRTEVGVDGEVNGIDAATGTLVRLDDRVLQVTPDAVRTLDGSRVGCFVEQVLQPDFVVGSEIGWIVAVVGATIHVSDLTDGECAVVTVDAGGRELGRPVVADRRVFVPERRTGTVHVVDPAARTATAHTALPGGDLRLRSRADFVAAYDTGTSVAALLDRSGVVGFVDTSVGLSGISAVLADDVATAVVGSESGDSDETVTGDGTDGVRTDTDAPVIDAGLLAATLQNPTDDPDNALPDDQLVANFAFSTTTAIVGETVRFVDGSTGGPESWLWDFGDGTGAEGPEVEKAWDEAGTYPVTLRITRGELDAEISLAITVVPAEVEPPPAADFVFSASVVEVGENVAFEDRSDGEIDRWRWDFGDGTNSTEQNASKRWDTPGRYLVQLTVANPQGADSASVFIEVIEGLQAPVAVLEVAQTEVDLGAPLVFMAFSSTDPATFTWNFGDGRTSTGTQVTHVFLAEGVFTVELTAQNSAGTSTASVDILVNPPTQPPIATIGALPDVIEVGDLVTLSSLSTNSPDTETWTFGDGGTATGNRVTHTWDSPGSYLLSLTATNSAGSDTVSRTIDVVAELPPPVAQIGDFNASPWVGETTLFLDASVDATAWLWDFGDGVTSTAPDPLHTFTTAGQKTVTLTVTNRNGTDTTSVVVDPRLRPIASFVVSATAIRAGESVTFTDDSVNAASWSWDFGDSTGSNAQNPIHTFTDPGTYGVVLTIENTTGDRDSFGPVDITVDPAAPALLGIEKLPDDGDDITTLETVSFAALVSPASGPIERFEVDFGDRSPTESGPSGPFSHAYQASGDYEVTITAIGPLGDEVDVSRVFTVVDPPPPLIQISDLVPDEAEVGSVTLIGEELPGSGPISAWRWEVSREGTIWNYTGRVTSHNFETDGVYGIRLIAESPVGAIPDVVVDTTITINIPPPPVIESLLADPAIATTGVLVEFRPTVSGSVTTWEWDYEGTGFTVGGPTGQHIFNTAGDKQVTLRVTGPFGQQDVRTVDLLVNPRPAPTVPVATPSVSVLTGTLVNLTSSDAGGRLDLTWDWEITNGASTITYTDATTSIDHLFDTAGSWTVTVTATDGLGISGSNVVFITVTDPTPPLDAGFTHAPTGTPLQIQFTDTSSGPTPDSWLWDFGDPLAVGNTTAQNPLVTYSAPGTYSVTLTVGAGAEVDSITISVTVT